MNEFYSKFDEVKIRRNNIKALKQNIDSEQKALEAYMDLPDINCFESEDYALEVLEDKFLVRAKEACEGSYSCGEDTYTQFCWVRGVKYKFRMDVEYNRHDKTYYYVDFWSTDLEPVE